MEIQLGRLRLVLRGFMDQGAYEIDTFAGTARRQSQRILASEAATHPDWVMASLDVDKAFLKGFTYAELAKATGEKERKVGNILWGGRGLARCHLLAVLMHTCRAPARLRLGWGCG